MSISFEEALKANHEIEQTVEFGEELFRPKDPVDNNVDNNWFAWRKKDGTWHKLTGSVFDDCTFFRVDGQRIYSGQEYDEAVKAYKLKHGIPLDVGPEWRPGRDKTLPIDLPMRKNYSNVLEEPKKTPQPKRKRITLDSTLSERGDVGTCIYVVAGEGPGFVSSMPEFPGCMSQGDTVIEALVNILQAYKDWVLQEGETVESIIEDIKRQNELEVPVGEPEDEIKNYRIKQSRQAPERGQLLTKKDIQCLMIEAHDLLIRGRKNAFEMIAKEKNLPIGEEFPESYFDDPRAKVFEGLYNKIVDALKVQENWANEEDE